MGRLVAVEGLCRLVSADDKNTVRVEVDLGDSGLQYLPGDALGIWPSNCPEVGACSASRELPRMPVLLLACSCLCVQPVCLQETKACDIGSGASCSRGGVPEWVCGWQPGSLLGGLLGDAVATAPIASSHHPPAALAHLLSFFLNTQAVDELLEVMGVDGKLQVQVPCWHYDDAVLPANATSMPLRDALARCYDLRQPKPELLHLLHARLAALHTQQQEQHAPLGTNSGNRGSDGGSAGLAKGGHGKPGRLGLHHVKDKDSASELSGGDAAAATQGELCAQGCIVDRLEVRGLLQGQGSTSPLFPPSLDP